MEISSLIQEGKHQKIHLKTPSKADTIGKTKENMGEKDEIGRAHV